jgi:hypothetical protein
MSKMIMGFAGATSASLFSGTSHVMALETHGREEILWQLRTHHAGPSDPSHLPSNGNLFT